MKFKVKQGTHVHKGQTYTKGQTVVSDTDLRKLFKEKFELVQEVTPPLPKQAVASKPPLPKEADEDEDEAKVSKSRPKPEEDEDEDSDEETKPAVHRPILRRK